MTDSSLLIHTIYDHPTDHPGHWVVRTCIVRAGDIRHETKARLFDDLDVAQAWIAQEYPGATMIQSQGTDPEPQIHEVWM